MAFFFIGGDFTTSRDYDLNIWQENTASVFTVQGESESRTVNLHLKEEVKVENARGELEMQLKPFDATGYSARLYVEKPDDTKVFFDGTVTDAENGIVSFILPYQATAVGGEIQCTVYLTKPNGVTLKTIGIVLDVQLNDLEDAVESTNEFSALVIALNGVQSALDNAQQAVDLANVAVAGANTAAQTANNAAANANNAADEARNIPYIGEDHYWYVYNPTTDQYEKTATQAGTQYATFGVNPATGNLEMYTTDTYSGANFNVNDSGELEVVI